jgi:hypothetical protein
MRSILERARYASVLVDSHSFSCRRRSKHDTMFNSQPPGGPYGSSRRLVSS